MEHPPANLHDATGLQFVERPARAGQRTIPAHLGIKGWPAAVGRTCRVVKEVSLDSDRSPGSLRAAKMIATGRGCVSANNGLQRTGLNPRR